MATENEYNHARYGCYHVACGRVRSGRRTALLDDEAMDRPAAGIEPVRHVIEGARAYAARRGLGDPHSGDVDYHSVRTHRDLLKDLAHSYDALPQDDPSAHKHFAAMRSEVADQYHHLTHRMGIKVHVTDEDPYPDVHALRHDVLNNKQIKVLGTHATGGHPFFTNDENDKFRAVHDVFGHLGTGRDFDRHGEEATYQAHSRMFTPLARGALAGETRGQNAHLIVTGGFGPQKIAILPHHLWHPGLAHAAAVVPIVAHHATRNPNWPPPHGWHHLGTEQSALGRAAHTDRADEHWDEHGPAESARWHVHETELHGRMYPHVLDDETVNHVGEWLDTHPQHGDGPEALDHYPQRDVDDDGLPEHPRGYQIFAYRNQAKEEDEGSISYLAHHSAIKVRQSHDLGPAYHSRYPGNQRTSVWVAPEDRPVQHTAASGLEAGSKFAERLDKGPDEEPYLSGRAAEYSTEHVAPGGQQYRLMHDYGGFSKSHVTAHQRLSNGKYRGVGYLSWFPGKPKHNGSSIDGGVIHKVQVSPQHQRRGLASAMLAYARERNPDLDIRHSNALTDEGRAWAEKVGAAADYDGHAVGRAGSEGRYLTLSARKRLPSSTEASRVDRRGEATGPPPQWVAPEDVEHTAAGGLPDGYTLRTREEEKTQRWGLPALHVDVRHDGQQVGSLSVHQRQDATTGGALVGHPNIYVDPDHQRKGLGTALYAEVHRRWPDVPVVHSPHASDDARALNETLKDRFGPDLHHGRKGGADAEEVDGDGWESAMGAQERVAVLVTGKATAPAFVSLMKVAHVSGNTVDALHCPVCGSGSVTARSDGSIECGFCTAAYTVQVQPQFSAFPQSVDGAQYPWPGRDDMGMGLGMGGPVPPGAAGEAVPGEDGDEEGGGGPPWAQGGAQGDEDPSGDDDEDEDDEDPEASVGGAKAPPFGKKSYRTSFGGTVTFDDYLDHLILTTAADQRRTAAAIKAERARKTG